jgi:hypothetical protein
LTIKFTQGIKHSRLRGTCLVHYSIPWSLILDLWSLQFVLADSKQKSKIKDQRSFLKKFSGDFVGRVTPVPIPNTEVKPVGADGTARVTAWESRKSPGLLKEARSVLS